MEHWYDRNLQGLLTSNDSSNAWPQMDAPEQWLVEAREMDENDEAFNIWDDGLLSEGDDLSNACLDGDSDEGSLSWH